MEVQQPPVPMLGYHQGEKYFTYMESEPAPFQFMIVFAHHSVHHSKDSDCVSSQ